VLPSANEIQRPARKSLILCGMIEVQQQRRLANAREMPTTSRLTSWAHAKG
jgi:hypothetical protein